jgi:hypothetical protein
MQFSCMPSLCSCSLACPLLAVRGWEQFKTDVVQHELTDQDKMGEFVLEGVLESFPQIIIGQVRALLIVEACFDMRACRFILGKSSRPASQERCRSHTHTQHERTSMCRSHYPPLGSLQVSLFFSLATALTVTFGSTYLPTYLPTYTPTYRPTHLLTYTPIGL